MFLYHRRVRWSRVYPPQQRASRYHRHRLLDFGHIICIVVLRTLELLLGMIQLTLTTHTEIRRGKIPFKSRWKIHLNNVAILGSISVASSNQLRILVLLRRTTNK